MVVVIHGGFWKSAYDYTLGQPLARSLAAEGWTAWNIEYRRVGNGGGTPQTFDDVAAAIDALAEVEDLDTSTVVTLGHSAGGHLAVWAAGREDPGVAVTHAISQAGVLDLVMSERMGLGGGAAASLLGHAPGPDDAAVGPPAADPARRAGVVRPRHRRRDRPAGPVGGRTSSTRRPRARRPRSSGSRATTSW